MVNKRFLLGILAIVLVFGMAVVGCDDDSTNPLSVEYKGEDAGGNIYTLTVTQNTNRAAYEAAAGDSYVLTIEMKDGTIKISKGTVTVISTDGTFTLQPSVAGSDTFSVVISGEDIKSIVGPIAVEGGTPITAGTFDTIYLRAARWVIPVSGAYGEQWATGLCVKISDFIDDFKIGNTYTVRISGTVDKKLNHPAIQFGLLKNGKWYGDLGVRNLPAIDAGSFEYTTTLTPRYGDEINQYGLDGTEEPFAQFMEGLNSHFPTHPEWDNEYSTIPEEIPDGTIMATIRSFSMIIQE